MTAAAVPAPAWPARARGRAGARLGAAALLHAALLAALVLGLDRVEVARRLERATQLVEVTLAPLPKPKPRPRPVAAIPHAVPPVRPPRTTAADPRSPRQAAPRTPAIAAPAEPAPIMALPLPAPDAPAAVAALPASAPASAPRLVLDPDVTRAAIARAAAAGPSLAQRGQAQTHVGPSTSGERLSQGVTAAIKPSCGSAAAGAGLLALPVLVYEEAAGKCTN